MPIFASLSPGNTAFFEEILLLWQTTGKTFSDLTGPKFESQTSRSRDQRVTSRPVLLEILKLTTFVFPIQLHAFKEANEDKLGSGLRSVEQAIELTTTNINWRKNHEDTVHAWLTAKLETVNY